MLWKKRDEFLPDTDFVAFATTVAYYQVLNNRRTKRRDRLIPSDNLLQDVAERSRQRLAQSTSDLHSLEDCLAQLPEKHRAIVHDRYWKKRSVNQIAEHLGQNANAISQLLRRIKSRLAECMKKVPSKAES